MDELHDKLLEIATTLSSNSLDAYLKDLSLDLRDGTHRSLERLGPERLKVLGSEITFLCDPQIHSIDELLGFARGAAAALDQERSKSRTEFVWTGPRSSKVNPRRSEQVLLDLIDGALERLWIVSYVTLAAGAIYESLNAAVDRSVDVKILLESSKRFGGQLDTDQVSQMRKWVPNAKYYRWLDQHDEFLGGSVHAKVFVADRSRALLTSANLTGKAMDRNMEAGILVSGGRLPKIVSDHFDELTHEGFLTPDEAVSA